jgi:hypothetical protein
MTAALALVLLAVLWMAWRARPPLDRTPHVSERWRREQLYRDGKS